MRTRVEVGPLTGDPIIVTVPDEAEVAEFRHTLMQAGIPDASMVAAVDCLPALIQTCSPRDAAELLSIVVNSVGLSADQYLGACLAVRGVVAKADSIRRRTV